MSTNDNKLYKKIIEFIEKNGEITNKTEYKMIVIFPIETLFDFISMCLSYFEKDEHPSIIIKGYEFEIDIMKIFEYYGIYTNKIERKEFNFYDSNGNYLISSTGTDIDSAIQELVNYKFDISLINKEKTFIVNL